jgi:hypothetical protein
MHRALHRASHARKKHIPSILFYPHILFYAWLFIPEIYFLFWTIDRKGDPIVEGEICAQPLCCKSVTVQKRGWVQSLCCKSVTVQKRGWVQSFIKVHTSVTSSTLMHTTSINYINLNRIHRFHSIDGIDILTSWHRQQ